MTRQPTSRMTFPAVYSSKHSQQTSALSSFPLPSQLRSFVNFHDDDDDDYDIGDEDNDER